MSEQPLSDTSIQPSLQGNFNRAPITLATAVTRMEGVEMPGQRFEIDIKTSPITVGDLRTLVNLPYELALHEDGGETILNRGDESNGTFVGATREVRWMLHTHPFGSNNPNLSAVDVMTTWRQDHERTIHMLVTKNGILTYRAPQHEPNRPGVPLENILRHLASWGGDEGFNLVSGTTHDGLPASDTEMGEATRQFAEASGMLVDEARWDDQAGLGRALEIINGSDGVKGLGDLAIEAAQRIIDASPENGVGNH